MKIFVLYLQKTNQFVSRMANKISLFNLKGGVGKSTTAINLCAALALRGKKCLLIDLDGQRNATLALGFSVNMGITIYDALVDPDLNTELKTYNYAENFDYVPSSTDLEGIEKAMAGRFGVDRILKMLVLGVEADYDYIIYDCKTANNLLSMNALIASDAVLVPHDCGLWSEAGIPFLVKLVKQAKVFNPDLRIMGFLLTKYQNTTLCRDAPVHLNEAYPEIPVLKTTIKYCTALGKGLDEHQTIFTYKGSAKAVAQGRVDYKYLASEVMEYFGK